MNQDDGKAQATEQQTKPKSKRLSSLIWIGVLWGVVRLVAELDHISWRRSFASDAIIFGLWPATFFLGLTLFFPQSRYTRHLRWAAFLSTVVSISSLFFFEKQNEGIDFIVIAQQIFAVAVVAAICIDWMIRRGKS